MKTAAGAAMVQFTIMLIFFLSAQSAPADPPAHADAERVPSIEMISIKGGTFTMGTAEGEFDEKPEHGVTLSPFRISKYKITVAQYRRFAQATGGPMPTSPEGGLRDDLPMVNVSWVDAQALARWLSSSTGRNFRLPTEAQWSYVAQGGGRSRYAYPDDEPGGNMSDASRGKSREKPIWKNYDDGFSGLAPVGSFPPNRLGVYDLDGNAAEWCRNWHYTYTGDQQTDPIGPPEGDNKVFRGAAFISDPWYSRIAQRNFMPTDFRADYLGIRLVEELPAEEQGILPNRGSSSRP